MTLTPNSVNVGILEEIMEYYSPWSHSKIYRMEEDPLLFFGPHTKKDMELHDKNLIALVGVVLHGFLENLFRKKIQMGDFYNYIDTQDVPEMVKEHALSYQDVVFSGHKKVIDLFRKEISPNSRPKILIEKKLNINIINPTKKISFMGVIDLVFISGNSAIIIDYKTSMSSGRGKAKDKAREESYRSQLKTYAILLMGCFPEITKVQLFIWNLKKAEVAPFGSLTATDFKTEKDTWLKKIMSSVLNNYYVSIKGEGRDGVEKREQRARKSKYKSSLGEW